MHKNPRQDKELYAKARRPPTQAPYLKPILLISIDTRIKGNVSTVAASFSCIRNGKKHVQKPNFKGQTWFQLRKLCYVKEKVENTENVNFCSRLEANTAGCVPR